MGGSSHINAQYYSRGVDEDYDRWERVYGAKGWNAKEMVHFMKLPQRVYEHPLVDSGRRLGEHWHFQRHYTYTVNGWRCLTSLNACRSARHEWRALGQSCQHRRSEG